MDSGPETGSIPREGISWDTYQTKLDLNNGYVRPQPEIDLQRNLDIRAAYCSTLSSFKDQVFEMGGGKRDFGYYGHKLSESNIIKASLKELKDNKVFTSHALAIMNVMLDDNNFRFTSKTINELTGSSDDSRAENSLKYRSALDSGVQYIPRQTTIRDAQGGTFHTPYMRNDNVLGALSADAPEYSDLMQANQNGNSPSHAFYPTTPGNIDQYTDKLYYNDVRSNNGAMMFSMLDAAGFAWSKRKYSTPGENVRPSNPERGHSDNMHYWSRILVESFVNSREVHAANKDISMPWEVAVRLFPDKCFKSGMIGGLCDRTWKEQFPLLSKNHPLRAKLERARSLSVMWYELKGYKVAKTGTSQFSRSERGAWIPLPVSHQMHLLRRVGMFDDTNKIPSNPWLERDDNGSGILKCFNQSYHSPWQMTAESGYFKDWIKTACNYQIADENNFRPFSQYGGHPVSADFVHHLIERPDDDKYVSARHAELVEQRYGNIGPLRMGKVFKDTGLLQNMFSNKYSPTAHVDKSQRDAYTKNIRISNFLAYARTHTIMALGSCNPGTQDISMTRAARNFFRLHVDTYKCAGKERNSDGVPVILGYVGKPVNLPEDKPILFIAGTMNCINTQMSKFCNSKANSNEQVCPMYKQLYHNDATILFEKLLRQERTRHRHTKNFARVREKDPTFSMERFDKYMLDLKEEHISFLNHIIIGMLQQNGLTDKQLPLGILEPRDMYVDPTSPQDTDLVGQDFLSPSTLESLDGIDFASEEFDYTQLSILSLTPPDVRAVALLRLNQVPEIVNIEHDKSQIQQKVMKDNAKAMSNYAKRVVQAGIGAQWLEGHHVNLAFDPDQFKDPLIESEKLVTKRVSSLKDQESELSRRRRSDDLRRNVTSSNSASMRLNHEYEEAIVKLDAEITSGARRHNSTKLTELASRSDIPDDIKRKLARMYMK
jgi:hypothetical protein